MVIVSIHRLYVCEKHRKLKCFNGCFDTSFKAVNQDITEHIPAAGYWNGASLNNVGSNGNVWSRSLNTSNIANGRNLNFNSSTINTNNNNRFNGFSARGVVAIENLLYCHNLHIIHDTDQRTTII